MDENPKSGLFEFSDKYKFSKNMTLAWNLPFLHKFCTFVLEDPSDAVMKCFADCIILPVGRRSNRKRRI